LFCKSAAVRGVPATGSGSMASKIKCGDGSKCAFGLLVKGYSKCIAKLKMLLASKGNA
jgi:hypothetical protein